MSTQYLLTRVPLVSITARALFGVPSGGKEGRLERILKQEAIKTPVTHDPDYAYATGDLLEEAWRTLKKDPVLPRDRHLVAEALDICRVHPPDAHQGYPFMQHILGRAAYFLISGIMAIDIDTGTVGTYYSDSDTQVSLRCTVEDLLSNEETNIMLTYDTLNYDPNAEARLKVAAVFLLNAKQTPEVNLKTAITALNLGGSLVTIYAALALIQKINTPEAISHVTKFIETLTNIPYANWDAHHLRKFCAACDVLLKSNEGREGTDLHNTIKSHYSHVLKALVSQKFQSIHFFMDFQSTIRSTQDILWYIKHYFGEGLAESLLLDALTESHYRGAPSGPHTALPKLILDVLDLEIFERIYSRVKRTEPPMRSEIQEAWHQVWLDSIRKSRSW